MRYQTILYYVYCEFSRTITFSYYSYRHCNREAAVWDVFNLFYVSIMYHIYHIWKTKKKTIQDSGYVLQGKFQSFCFAYVPSYIHLFRSLWKHWYYIMVNPWKSVCIRFAFWCCFLNQNSSWLLMYCLFIAISFVFEVSISWRWKELWSKDISKPISERCNRLPYTFIKTA